MATTFQLHRPGLLSLCSGTGMLDIAIELAWEQVFGIRPRVVGFAEREAYAASLLLARMEEKSLEPAPVFCGDFRDLDARPLRGFVDLFAAGLPCQPYSTAGKQHGLKDARSWGGGEGPLPHALRIIEEAEPAVVCLENVPQWVTGGAFRKFGEALCALGFTLEDPLFIRAKDVGASHQRERVFILAHRKSERSELFVPARSRREGQGKPDAERTGAGVENAALQYWAQHGRKTPESGWSGVDLADADVERCGREQRAGLCDAATGGEGLADAGGAGLPHAEQRGERGEPRQSHHAGSTAEFRGSLLADTHRERCSFLGAIGGELGTSPLATLGHAVAEFHHSLFAPGPDSGDWAHILERTPWLAPALKPGFRVLADGMALALDASRADQLRCGGNGVVVGQAAASFVHLFRRLVP